MRGCAMPQKKEPRREARGCSPMPKGGKKQRKPSPIGIAFKLFRAFAR